MPVRFIELKIRDCLSFIQILLVGFTLLVCRAESRADDSSSVISEKWLNTTTWQWRAELAEPVIKINTINGARFSSVAISGLENSARSGYPSLPVYHKLFNALPDEISYQVQSSPRSVIKLAAKAETFQDRATDDDSESPIEPESYTIYPSGLVSVEFVGYFKGMPLSSVSIFPCQLLSNGLQLKNFSSMTVLVTINPGTRLEKSTQSGERQVLNALDLAADAIRKIPGLSKTLTKTSHGFPAGRIYAKLTVNEDGIYRISSQTLSDSGIVLKRIDPRTFRLYNKGNEVPIYVYGESDGTFDGVDYIEFFGERNRNSVANYKYDPFSDKNVYWLIWGEGYGLRYAEESVQTSIPIDETITPNEYLYTAHIEVNSTFHRLGQVDINQPTYVRDHWFFDSGIYGGTNREYSFDLHYPNPNQVSNFSAVLRMQGISYNAGDHQVTYDINNYEVGSGAWNGQSASSIQSSDLKVLRNNYLKDGVNTLQISVAGDDPTNKYDMVAMDYLDIKYFRLYKADDDEIEFTRPEGSLDGTYTFTVTNFRSPDISIYKVGKSKLRDFSSEYVKSSDSYKVTLQDYITDDTTRYWAACGGALKMPLFVKLDTLTGWSTSQNGADMVIITRQEWVNSLEDLTDFYSKNGLTAEVVGIQDVYDEFNAGIVSPFAIKKFLQYAYYNWNPAPEYVLLIGDAGLKEEKSVPPFFFQSYKYGACASDFWYALVDDDEVPDYAIGRWPCTTNDELELLIDKRINYTKENLIGSWNNELLFIAGMEDVFKDQSENMIQRQVGKAFNANRIYINPASVGSRFFGGSDTLIYLLNKGITLGNFMGHGGGAVWADRSLFNSSHIQYLDNLDRLPFLTSLTCFTGDFTDVTGIGEMLLLAGNGGAIGLWGASSVGWIKNDYLLAKPFYDVIFEPDMTVGKAIQTAKIRYQADQGNFDYLKSSMLYSYNLIGDPTVSLPFPGESVLLNIDKTNPSPGDTVNLYGTLPYTSGEMTIQLYDSSKYSVYSEPHTVQFSAANFSQQIIFPDSINAGSTFINYYLKNSTGTSDAHGVTLFDIRGLTFYGFNCSPTSPHRNTPITLTIFTELSDIQSMYCEIDTFSAYEYLDDNGIEHVIGFQNDSALMSIPLTVVPSIATKWQTSQTFSVETPGKLIAVRFVGLDSGGERTFSGTYSFSIKKAPDLYPVSMTQGGEKFPELIATITNSSDDTLTATVKAERITDQGTQLFGLKEVVFLPDQKTLVKFPGILGQDTVIYKISVDPDNKISESDESNNALTRSMVINTFAVLPGLGSTYDGISSNTIRIAGIFDIYIASTSVTDSAVIILRIDTNLTIAGQPKFSLISPSAEYSSLGLQAAWGDETSVTSPTVSIKIDLSNCSTSNVSDLSIGKWNSSLRIWYEEASALANSTIATESSIPGAFSLITNTDIAPPTIELNLEGQVFFQNSYVSDKPSISIVGEDDNGVRFDADGIKVFIDEAEIPFNELNAPDTVSDGHYLAVQFRPTLATGSHSMKVLIQDAAGNKATETVDFTVSDELKLIDYGNYPNPFKSKTTFIYELTQRVNSLKIKIYTTSGRLIRVLDSNNVFDSGLDLNEGGYHEVTWDGLDEDGNFVANGIYFYKIYAKSGSKNVTKTGKMAKAR